MNTRLQLYKANLLQGMNNYNAAKAAGYSEATARKHTNRLNKVAKGGIMEALERAGLTLKYRAGELAKLTQAMRIQNVNIVLKQNPDTGKLEIQDTDDFIEVPDNSTRIQAHKIINELNGDIKSKVEHSGQINFVTMKSIEIIREVDGKPHNRIMEFDIGEAFNTGDSKNTE